MVAMTRMKITAAIVERMVSSQVTDPKQVECRDKDLSL